MNKKSPYKSTKYFEIYPKNYNTTKTTHLKPLLEVRGMKTGLWVLWKDKGSESRDLMPSKLTFSYDKLVECGKKSRQNEYNEQYGGQSSCSYASQYRYYSCVVHHE